MAIYERHQPEQTILYQTVARAWPKISLDHAIEGETIPRHVEAEFDRYKRFGILDYGFVRLYSKACAIRHETKYMFYVIGIDR